LKKFKFDRRIIFILIALAVIIPLMFPLNIPIKADRSENNGVYKTFKLLDSLPENSIILISFDFDPAAAPELLPMGVAIIEHAFSKDINVITCALWPQGVRFAEEALVSNAEKYDKERWINFVNLGYKAGGVVAIDNIVSDLQETFPVDLYGVGIDEIETVSKVKNNLEGVAVIITLSAGDPGVIGWVQIAGDRYGKIIIAGCTAVSAPAYRPYFNSGQLSGLLGGMAGAAEYEQLIEVPGTASRGMDAQSIAHILIIVFILIGNIAFLISRRMSSK